MNRLTKTKVKQAKRPPTKHFDGKGLYLLVGPNGQKGWRFKYRFEGREKLLSFGTYPEVSLEEARKRRLAARKLLAAEPPVDPSVARQAAKAVRSDVFKNVGAEWFADKQTRNAKITRDRNQFILDRLSDRVGTRPVSKIETVEMKLALLHIQENNGVETARRARGIASRIFAYAIAHGRASHDPTAGLEYILKDRNTVHRAAITNPKQFAELLRAIYAYEGHPSTTSALKLLALNFTRPTELRLGKWEEVDLDRALWVIPASRMKMRRRNPNEHLLPLASQSIEILQELYKLTGRTGWVFPGNKPDKPLNENAFNNALRKMGYTGDVHTAHGFRSTASTLLHEQNVPVEVIETQLAHARIGVSGIYNRSHLLPQRRKMLQHWANYLDELRGCGETRQVFD